MARVSIEERAAAAGKKLARAMGWKRSDTMGKLYFLWHDSQELEQKTCTVDDLILWMELESSEEKRIVPAMVDAGLLRIDGDTLQIAGNEKHIENLRQRREAAAIGGKRSGEVRALKAVVQPNASQKIEANASTERSNQTQASDEPCSLQFSAVQCFTEKQESNSFAGAHVHEVTPNDRDSSEIEVTPGFPGNPPEPVDPDKALTANHVAACELAWIATLETLEVGRSTVMPHEKMAIGEAITRLGFKTAIHALTGYRFEPPTPTYDPKKHVKISRVFAHELWEKWVNLACQAKESNRKAKEKADRIAARQEASKAQVPHEEEAPQ